MPQRTFLSNVLNDSEFWAKVKAEQTERFRRIEADRKAQASLPTCKRCKQSKVYKAGQNFCRPCSYC